MQKAFKGPFGFEKVDIAFSRVIQNPSLITSNNVVLLLSLPAVEENSMLWPLVLIAIDCQQCCVECYQVLILYIKAVSESVVHW